MKRRSAVLGAALALLVALVALGTAAYLTKEVHTTNVITTGNIDITLQEFTKDASGAKIDWPENGISGVMPGQSVDKLVSVENAGSGEAWVRVQVTSTITGADKKPLSVDGMLAFDFDTANWLESGDYYYYTTPLAAGDTTPELFKTVTFSKDMPNAYQGCTVNVVVTAQAVQVKNNQGTGDTPITTLNATNVSQINGWPATSGTTAAAD